MTSTWLMLIKGFFVMAKVSMATIIYRTRSHILLALPLYLHTTFLLPINCSLLSNSLSRWTRILAWYFLDNKGSHGGHLIIFTTITRKQKTLCDSKIPMLWYKTEKEHSLGKLKNNINSNLLFLQRHMTKNLSCSFCYFPS